MKNYLFLSAAMVLLSLGACTNEESSPAPYKLVASNPPPAPSPAPAPTRPPAPAPTQPPAPGPGSPPATGCDPYPVVLNFSPAEAEIAARTELESFAPNSSLEWSASNATLSKLLVQNTPFACDGDVYDSFFALAERFPALFRLERGDWAPNSASCSNRYEPDPFIVSMLRSSFGGLPIVEDKLSFTLQRSGDGFTFRGAIGFYLPPATDAQVALLNACRSAPTATFETAARAETYPYEVFDNCGVVGGGTYTPTSADRFEFDDPYWSWDEAPGSVAMRRLRRGRLFIDPGSLTPELRASSAYCFDDDHAGFELHFDDVTGEVLSFSPGIGCTVC
jgi:hypothetical protein